MYPQHLKIKPVRATRKNYLKSSAVKSVGSTSTSQLPLGKRVEERRQLGWRHRNSALAPKIPQRPNDVLKVDELARVPEEVGGHI